MYDLDADGVINALDTYKLIENFPKNSLIALEFQKIFDYIVKY